jgi:hypothetical protein
MKRFLLELLVAHYELQLFRAYQSGNALTVWVARQRLRDARARLERASA